MSYQIALSVIENKQFRDFIVFFSKSLFELLPASGNTIRRWIIDIYKDRKAAFIADVRYNAQNLIHVFFNLWTSPNSLAFITVVIYYINNNYKIRTRFIILRRLHGDYNRENQARNLMEILKEYEFVDLVGYFVINNIGSNDTCINCVL